MGDVVYLERRGGGDPSRHSYMVMLVGHEADDIPICLEIERPRATSEPERRALAYAAACELLAYWLGGELGGDRLREDLAAASRAINIVRRVIEGG